MADIQQSVITKILNRNKNQPARQKSKPYARPASTSRPYTSADPDAGVWKHDLAERPSLISRLSSGGAKGRELLPEGRPVGSRGNFAPVAGPSAPRGSTANGSRGVELLPAGGPQRRAPRTIPDPTSRLLVRTGLQGSSGNAPQQKRNVNRNQGAMSIMGAAKSQSVWVRIEGLAAGTTAEDVVAVFAPLPITSSNQVSSPSAAQSIVDLEFQSRDAALQAVQKYNGAVADGNTLTVKIMETKSRLLDRMGQGSGSGGEARDAMELDQPNAAPPVQSTSKLYSDSILQSDPRATVITLATDTPRRNGRNGRNDGGRGRRRA